MRLKYPSLHPTIGGNFNYNNNKTSFISDREVKERAARALDNDVPAIAPMTPRRTPSSYSRHDMITPSPSPWDVSNLTPPESNTPTSFKPDDELLLRSGPGVPDVSMVPLKSGDDHLLSQEVEDHTYVDMTNTDMIHLGESPRTEMFCDGMREMAHSSRCPHLAHQALPSPLSSPLHCSNRHQPSHSRCQPCPLSPKESFRSTDKSRKKSSTSRPLDVESRRNSSSSQNSPSKFFSIRKNTDNSSLSKLSTTEALLQQLNTLTVAAPGSSFQSSVYSSNTNVSGDSGGGSNGGYDPARTASRCSLVSDSKWAI